MLTKWTSRPSQFVIFYMVAPYTPASPTIIYCLIRGLWMRVLMLRMLRFYSPHTAMNGKFFTSKSGRGNIWVLKVFTLLGSSIVITVFQSMTKYICVGRLVTNNLSLSYSSKDNGSSSLKTIDSVFCLKILSFRLYWPASSSTCSLKIQFISPLRSSPFERSF